MSAVKCPNVVRFFGASLEPRICMVLEYCKRKSLHKVLNKVGKVEYNISWKRALKFAIDMFSGIDFLHRFTPAIFHRDVKSANLLVRVTSFAESL